MAYYFPSQQQTTHLCSTRCCDLKGKTMSHINAEASTTTAQIINPADSKMPSIPVDEIKGKVVIVENDDTNTQAENQCPSEVSQGTPSTQVNKTEPFKPDYSPILSVERAIGDNESIISQDRAYYVAEFKRGEEKTARATLETCRVVFEAHHCLDSYQFQNFCREIGYRDNSSTIRKFIAIGKVYPRFIQYADQMPSGWTAIYQITQIPADNFESMIKNGQRLDALKGKRLKALMGQTRSLENITSATRFDSAAGGFEFAKIVAVRQFDDVDWRAIEKAMNELQARLPVKFVVPAELTKLVEQRRLRRYQSAKKHYKNQEFAPDTWDMGDEANGTLPREEPPTV